MAGAGGGEELEGWGGRCEMGGSPSSHSEEAPSPISVRSLVPGGVLLSALRKFVHSTYIPWTPTHVGYWAHNWLQDPVLLLGDSRSGLGGQVVR